MNSGSMRIRLSILMFLQYFVWGSWYVTAGTYLMQGLHFSGREIGLVYGSSAIAALISPFIIGILADKYFGLERILLFLQALSIMILWSLSEIQTFELFYPVILLYMLIFLPASTLVNSICFHHLKDSKTEFPKIRVWGTIAWIIAGLNVAFLDVEDKATPFKIASITTVVLFLYCLTLPKTKAIKSKAKTLKDFIYGSEIKMLLQDRSFKILFLCVTLICIPGAFYYSFLNPFLNEIGVENAAAKMSLGQITEIIVLLLLPFAFRVFKLKYVIFTGLVLWGIRYVLLCLGILINSEFLYIVCISMHGFAYVFALLSAQIILDIKVPEHLRSTAQGFFSFMSLGIGTFIGSTLAGEVVSIYKLDNGMHDWFNIWLIPGIFGLAVSVFFLIYFKGFNSNSQPRT